MKHTEKLDLILRELYKYKFDGNHYSIKELCEDANISLEPFNEARTVAKRLENDGLINVLFTFDDCLAEINSYGVEYCESDSYTFQNQSIITNNYNLSIANSPNSNIVTSSSNVTININNQSEIKNKIKEIRNAIIESVDTNEIVKSELEDCLLEIETIIECDKKPKSSFKQLVEIGSGISGISTLIIELGKLIFG